MNMWQRRSHTGYLNGITNKRGWRIKYGNRDDNIRDAGIPGVVKGD